MKYCNLFILLITLPRFYAERQTVRPDVKYILRPLRRTIIKHVGHSSEDLNNLQNLSNIGRLQNATLWPTDFFCNVTHGAGRRGATPPTSVHRLRAGDIDIVGALGDSITAGSIQLGRTLFDWIVENRGVAFSSGGQGTWREYLTLPNILKEYNPQLYGYSLRDSLTIERESRFNPAESGAIVEDMPYMSRILHQRMSRDPNVNMTDHWKIVTIFIGGNDICTYMCHSTNLKKYFKLNEINLLRTLRYLRDHIPRLLVIFIPVSNINHINNMKYEQAYCETLLKFTCDCVYGKDTKYMKKYVKLSNELIALHLEVAARAEFNTETFTVTTYDIFDNLKLDKRFVALDCFHLNQLGHAAITTALWNNMYSYDGEKIIFQTDNIGNLRCPTEERPYITTRDNVRADFDFNV